jgi:hypothetical protein
MMIGAFVMQEQTNVFTFHIKCIQQCNIQERISHKRFYRDFFVHFANESELDFVALNGTESSN